MARSISDDARRMWAIEKAIEGVVGINATRISPDLVLIYAKAYDKFVTEGSDVP